MAKIEIVKEETEESPRTVECIEAVVWGQGGTSSQEFQIGSGANFDASSTFWLEIRYSLQGISLFYTRNMFQRIDYEDTDVLLTALEQFPEADSAVFGFCGMLPETSIFLTRNKHSYTDADGETQNSVSYSLKISADMGAVFSHTSPGGRMLDICLKFIDIENGQRFMRELVGEIDRANQGLHPDPASLPPGFSDWPFVRELNRQAYNRIAIDYQEDYFAEPLIVAAFDDWLAQLPEGGQILDAGCGHGDPVIKRLLERGLRVIGSDLSPVMLAQAREHFPLVEFWERAITEINAEEVFEAVCSFSSMLYLDPIDFFHSIHRLYRALKPGGSLFLYGYDLHPGWRGDPYHVDLGHWMWGGTRGLDETILALEEHGYFKVLKTLETGNPDDRQEKIEAWQAETEKKQVMIEDIRNSTGIAFPNFPQTSPNVSYPYIVIAQKQSR